MERHGDLLSQRVAVTLTHGDVWSCPGFGGAPATPAPAGRHDRAAGGRSQARRRTRSKSGWLSAGQGISGVVRHNARLITRTYRGVHSCATYGFGAFSCWSATLATRAWWPSAACSRRLSPWHRCCQPLRSQAVRPSTWVAGLRRALRRTLGFAEEDRTMNRTRRTIGLSAFVMLAVLGTGWALEKASSNSRTKDGAAVSEPAKASDAIPTSREPLDVQPAATGASPEYDRSDLILSQG